MRRALCLIVTILLTLPLLTAPALAEAQDAIQFHDALFEKRVRAQLEKPEGPITYEDAAGVLDLNLGIEGESVPEEDKLRDISDVENFPNLVAFAAYGNAIEDISPLSKLKSLEYLDLGGNPLKSLKPLSKLTGLRELTLWYCGISDLSPLKGLKQLESLDAKGNRIEDIEALKGLTSLRRLDLINNQVRDAGPLSKLTGLEALALSGNPVLDWSVLADVHKSLTESDFTPDQLGAGFAISFEDSALEQKVRAAVGKKKGKITYADVTTLSDFYASFGGGKKEKKIKSIEGLEYFTTIFKFEAFDQEFTDLTPLEGLENLGILAVDGCPVTDLTPVAGMDNLRILQVSRTGVSDLAPLKGLDNLGTLEAQGNQISDISALAEVPNLDALDLSYNNISDLSALSGLTKLTSLRLAGNPVSDFTPIRDLLPNLTDRDFEPLFADDAPETPIEIADAAFEAALRRALDIWDRPITQRDAYLVRTLGLYNEKTPESEFSDISPLKWFVNLEELEFNSNPVTDLGALKGLTKLRRLNAGFLQVSDVSPLAGLENLESLSLSFCPVADVTPLENLARLSWLDLSDTQVTDVSPLAGLTNLRSLRLGNSPVEDYGPLKAIYGNLEDKDFTVPK